MLAEIKGLKELLGKLQETRTRVAKAFEEAKAEQDGQAVLDFAQVKVYGSDPKTGKAYSTIEIAEKVRADNEQMDDLAKQVESLRAAENAAVNLEKPKGQMFHPGEKDRPDRPQYKGFRQALAEMCEGKEPGWLKRAVSEKGGLVIPDVSINEFKTLFETSAGWAPESVRSGRPVEAVTRPIQILDIIPTGPIGQAAAVYMEETTRTHNAAEKAEGTTYAESEFALTEQSKTVRKITDSVPVTDEQLEDVAQAQSYLENRIRFGIRQRLDYQVLNGDDIAPNLGGILNNGSIQTQAKGADPIADAVYKAMTKILVTGRAMATHNLMHPTDWQTVRLLRTVDGVYIWGNPSEAGPERLWGLPVVKTDALSVGTGLVGSFEGAWIQLLERRGVILEVGYTGAQFVEGKQTIRASMRAVLVIYRAPAFCEVTGL